MREVLGLALYGEERWQEALTELKAYRRMSGRADQNHIIADCLRALGRPAEAVPLAEEELRARCRTRRRPRRSSWRRRRWPISGGTPRRSRSCGRAQTRDDVAEAYTLRLWYVRGDILAQGRARRTRQPREFRKVMRHDAAAFDAAERLAALG